MALAGGIALAAVGWFQFPAFLHGIGPWAGSAGQALLQRLSGPRAELEFRTVAAEIVGRDEGAVLIVGGEIANVAAHDAALPHLEILVRNGDEQVLAAWTSAPPRPQLGPGEAVRFETRLASPPPDSRQVRVHFTAAGGIAVAARSPDSNGSHP
jgi:hypothetical protein